MSVKNNFLTAGSILAAHDDKTEPGAWFIIYADGEGALAFDLTQDHPTIGYKGFEAVLSFQDTKPETEKVVLLGGPERSEDALIILHETSAANEDSTIINDQFAFMPYNYVLISGKPPRLTRPDNQPSRISLKKPSNFLIAMGYRIFDGPVMMEEISKGNWLYLPATTDIIFGTSRHDRRAKLLNQLN